MMRLGRAILASLVLGAPAPLLAQTAETTTPETVAPGDTAIDSDELRADQESHVAVFSGNVVVTGTNFTMRCQEMTVTFTKDSKVDRIVAQGEVIIEQPGRITHSGRAEYYREEDKFVLLDQPVIADHGNQVSAPRITIYRSRNAIITSGGRQQSRLHQGPGAGTPRPPATAEGTVP